MESLDWKKFISDGILDSIVLITYMIDDWAWVEVDELCPVDIVG
jgi:hypothetical protein